MSLAIIALLLRSMHEGRLLVWPLALTVAGALAVRLDSILLAAPIALTAFVVHPPRQAILRGLTIAVILAAPVGAWTARNLAVGLPVMPPEFFLPRFPLAKGYVHWGYGWTVSEYQYPGWYNAAVAGAYNRIAIDPNIYFDEVERKLVEDAVMKLRGMVGQPIPPEIDLVFAELDRRRREAEPAQCWFVRPARRISNMWFNPLNSTAWPVDVRPSVVASAQGDTELERLWSLAMNHPVSAMVKVGSAIYRLVLLGLAVWILLLSWERGGLAWRGLVWAAAAYGVGRTLFFAYFPLVETRYIMPVTPWLEVAVVLGLLVRFWPQAAPGLLAVRPPSPGS